MGRVALRLARFGAKNTPFFRVVAIDSRKARDDMPIEYLGTYDPKSYALDGVKEPQASAPGKKAQEAAAKKLEKSAAKATASEGKKAFHTLSEAAYGSPRAGGLLGAAMGGPVLSSFSGLFSRPAAVLHRVR